jgi:hypothetical protein
MSDAVTTCSICGLPASIGPARNPGESRPAPPLPADFVGTPPDGMLGRMMLWYEVTCVSGFHRKLISEDEYLQLSGALE